METTITQAASSQSNHVSITNYNRGDGDELVLKRLDILLAANAETDRRKSLFRTEREKLEASMMKNPVSIEKTFALFGLLLGSIPSAAMFTRFLIDSGTFRNEGIWILGVVAIVNLITATVGYFSGKFIGRTVSELEKTSWLKMLAILPFVGILWGIMAGGAGGVVIFVVGGFFGALLGALVGSVALPIFAVFHRMLKRGDEIELKHFLPLAFGITFTISAFFLGL